MNIGRGRINDEYLKKVTDQGKRVFVFLGHAGSGKSEIAVNWALILAAAGHPVRFFDMDQSKPMFRSRELAGLMQENNILLEKPVQFLDAPIVPHGVLERIKSADSFVILDVGGNAGGARTIAQFSEAWGNAVSAYLVVNFHRPFSSTRHGMLQTMESILSASRIGKAGVISNPNYGEQTLLDDVIYGHKNLEAMLEGTGFKIEFLVTSKALQTDVKRLLPGIDIFGITRFIKASCEM